MATQGWGTGPWGTMPWGGAVDGNPASACCSFFLPPTMKVNHYPRVSDISGRPWALWRQGWHRTGDGSLGSNPVTIGAAAYYLGRWNGPLTDQQISDLTSAGYAARIVKVLSENQLPPGLD